MLQSGSGNGSPLGSQARPLLGNAEIRYREELFARKDGQASQEQSRFFRMMTWLNLLVLAVGVLSGLLLAVAIIDGWEAVAGAPLSRLDGYVAPANRILVVLIIVCTIAATALGRITRDGDRLTRYRKLRSEAETARTERFTILAKLSAENGMAAALDALDLINEQLVADQRAFYLERAGQHRESAALTGRWAAFGIVLAALASVAAVTVLSSEWTQPLLVLGVIAAAVSAYAIDREGLYRDRANAELYELTADRLGGLAAGIDRVRAEIEAGNPSAVVTFAELVAEELQQEHRRWVAGLDVTSQLLARLEERLADAKARGEPAGFDRKQRSQPEPDRLEEKPAAVAEPVPPKARLVEDETPPAPEPATAEPPASAPRTPVAEDVQLPAEPPPSTTPVTLADQSRSTPPTSASTEEGAVAPQAIASELARWIPVLQAASAALPEEHSAQARALLEEAGALAEPLNAAAPASDVVARASRLLGVLQGGGPVAQWLQVISPAASAAMPPLAIVLGAAGIAARLGEDAYRRWVAAVLSAPIPPALVQPAVLDVTVALAALEVAPIFGEALQSERREKSSARIIDIVRRALTDPDGLWPEVSTRFGDDRSHFDAGIRELSRALLEPMTRADLAGIAASLPGGASPEAILAVGSDPVTAPSLQATVLLLHEIRAEGGPAAAEMLVAALQQGAGK